ncbi:MAG: carbon dioxide concentrating mechanism protein [Limnothrix sp. RL_2_0]|nr:carbon dioxide concentrating mechanism protein [Limnothrix sp. RL_2_0]
MGSILQAGRGSIKIQQGVTLGAGVLIIGAAEIGENTCVGYGSTIFQASVIASQVLPPNSLIGDNSRNPINQTTPSPPSTSPKPKPTQTTNDFDPWNPAPSPQAQVPVTESSPQQSQTKNLEKEPNSTPEIIPDIAINPPKIFKKEVDNTPKVPVVGQVYINQLLMTLFPNNNQIKPIDTSQETE